MGERSGPVGIGWLAELTGREEMNRIGLMLAATMIAALFLGCGEDSGFTNDAAATSPSGIGTVTR